MEHLFAVIAAPLFAAGTGASFAAEQPAAKPAAGKNAKTVPQKYRVVIQVSGAG